MLSSLQRTSRTLIDALFGMYAALLFALIGAIAVILVMLPIGLAARRHIAHFTARTFFVLCGVRVVLHNRERLPAGASVVVANHASYLDGVVMKAALPARFSFVIKSEMSKVPIAALLLRRIGSEFVDRFNRHASGMAARRLLKAAESGQALAFFPEGTFVAEPGLGKFHTGAFAIAARTQLPVVPVSILGTRDMLPCGRPLPRHGSIHIYVMNPIPAANDTSSSEVARLRDEAREAILSNLHEPDREDADNIAALAQRKA
jgi:1-acyl-sn-glycerol-3-phosphate acyltransferase